MIGSCGLPMMYNSNYILTAAGQIKKLGIYSIVMGISSIVMSYAFLMFTDWRLCGVAFAASIPYFIRCLYSNFDACRQLNISIPASLRSFLWTLPLWLLTLVLWKWGFSLWQPSNLFEVLVCICVLASAVAVLGLFLPIAAKQDKDFIATNIKRLCGKLK